MGLTLVNWGLKWMNFFIWLLSLVETVRFGVLLFIRVQAMQMLLWTVTTRRVLEHHRKSLLAQFCCVPSPSHNDCLRLRWFYIAIIDTFVTLMLTVRLKISLKVFLGKFPRDTRQNIGNLYLLWRQIFLPHLSDKAIVFYFFIASVHTWLCLNE